MKEIINKAKDYYDKQYAFVEYSLAIESSAGDKILRQGIKGWREALDILYNSGTENEHMRGLEKAYEANKLLIINQKIKEIVDNQVKVRTACSYFHKNY